MNLLSVLGACLMIVAAGFGALRLVGVQGQQSHSVFAFSWVLGTGIVSLLIWVLGLMVGGALIPTLVSICCLSLFFWGAKVSANRLIILPRLSQASKIEILLGAILLIEIGAMFYWSYVHTLGLDGILNWEIKARYGFASNGALPSSYFQDSGRAFTHPGYPLGIPNTEMWLYFWLGDSNQFWAKTIFPLFYAAGALLLVALSAHLIGWNTPGLIAAVLLFFVPQVSVEGGSAVVGYADFPLGTVYLATIGSLLVYCRSEDGRWFRCYAACLALLPWIKVEGALLWLLAALCGAWVIFRRKGSSARFLALLPGAMILSAWHIYLACMHTVSSHDFLSVNLSNLWANIYRLGPIGARLLEELTNLEIWGLSWLVFIVSAVLAAVKFRNLMAIVLLTAIISPIAVYCFSYVLSPWPDYLGHMGVSISRLLMHVAPLGLLMTAIVAAESWRELPGASIASAGTRTLD